MKTQSRNLTVFMLFLATGASHAGPSSYQCVVSEELRLQSDGTVVRPTKPLTIGQRFAIDRRTGSLVGPESSLWTLGDAKATVLATGDSDNGFVATLVGTARGQGVHATLIRVEEYAASPKKPFLVLSGGGVYSGLCE